MSKSNKYRSGFSQILALIILSVIAVSSFVAASKFGNQSQELRSRAQTYTVSPTPFTIDCMSDVNPHNFCATATYCPDGFTKISGYCKNNGACCKKDLAPCMSTANPNNFCATATYCPTGFTKISGYCSNKGSCCKKDLLPTPKPTPSPIACMSSANPNNFCATATYCPTGFTKISGFCANSGACCKKNLLPTPKPSPINCTVNSTNHCAHYCEDGFSKTTGYCDDEYHVCCKQNCMRSTSPDNFCATANYCPTGFTKISDYCDNSGACCRKDLASPSPSPSPTPIPCNPYTTSNRCFPYKCNPGYVSTIGACTSKYDVCCTPGIITKPIDSLTCGEYKSLIGWTCDPKKVETIFEGQIACPNGPTKKKGCRLYCETKTNKVKLGICDWIPDNAITNVSTQVQGKPMTWSYCPVDYRNTYTEAMNYAKNIVPRNGLRIYCFVDPKGDHAVTGDGAIIAFWSSLNFDKYRTKEFTVHELMHAWQYQENMYNLGLKSYSNENLNRAIGCRQDPNDTSRYIFDFEDAMTDYGKIHCDETLAEAARLYVYPDDGHVLSIYEVFFHPVAWFYKILRPKTYNVMKGIFGGTEYMSSSSQQFNPSVSPVPKTSPILNTNSF